MYGRLVNYNSMSTCLKLFLGVKELHSLYSYISFFKSLFKILFTHKVSLPNIPWLK